MHSTLVGSAMIIVIGTYFFFQRAMQSVEERVNFNYDGDDNQWIAVAYLKMKRDIIALSECKDVEYLIDAAKEKEVEDVMEKIENVKSPRRMELQSVCESLERTRRELKLLQQGHENEMQNLEAELSKMYMDFPEVTSNFPSDEFREDREQDRPQCDDELRNRYNYSFFDSVSETAADEEDAAKYSDAESETSFRGSRSDDAESRLSEEMITSYGDRSEFFRTGDDATSKNEVDVFERIRQSSTSYSTTYTIEDIKQQNRLSHKLKLESEAESMLRALGITESESKASLLRYDDYDSDDGELSEKGYVPADDNSTLNSYVDTSCYNTDGEDMTTVTGCDTEFLSRSINSNDNCDASCNCDDDEAGCTASGTVTYTEAVTTFDIGNSTSSLTNKNEEKTELDTRSCGLTDACFTFFSFTTAEEAAKDSDTDVKQDDGCTDDSSIDDSSKSSLDTTGEEAELAHFAATTSIFAIEAVKSKRIMQHINHININISRSSERSKNEETELARFAATTTIFEDVSRTMSVDECVYQATSNESRSLSLDECVDQAASNEANIDDNISCGDTGQSTNEKILADDITSCSSDIV
jgi:hypothetical protein